METVSKALEKVANCHWMAVETEDRARIGRFRSQRCVMQVLDGTCCDEAEMEIESEAEDIPEIMIDSGAVPEHDAGADYEPDLDGEEISEDEEEMVGRTGRGAQVPLNSIICQRCTSSDTH